MKTIDDIVERNKRVEQDKAWEVSRTTRMLIVGLTYICAAFLCIRLE